jgi:hypothetical protein
MGLYLSGRAHALHMPYPQHPPQKKREKKGRGKCGRLNSLPSLSPGWRDITAQLISDTGETLKPLLLGQAAAGREAEQLSWPW